MKNNREMGDAAVRESFKRAYIDYEQRAEEMLSSNAVGGYKTIRDKLISHNEIRPSTIGCDFFDVKEAKLKYGDERRLLETASTVNRRFVVDRPERRFQLGTPFPATKNALHCDFWQVTAD